MSLKINNQHPHTRPRLTDPQIIIRFKGSPISLYLQATSNEGKDFGKLHAQINKREEVVPLQYSFSYHLAEASNDRLWVVPEQDKKL